MPPDGVTKVAAELALLKQSVSLGHAAMQKTVASLTAEFANVSATSNNMRYMLQEEQDRQAQRDAEVAAYRARVEALAEEMEKLRRRGEQTNFSVVTLRKDHEATTALTHKAHGWLQDVETLGKQAHARNSELEQFAEDARVALGKLDANAEQALVNFTTLQGNVAELQAGLREAVAFSMQLETALGRTNAQQQTNMQNIDGNRGMLVMAQDKLTEVSGLIGSNKAMISETVSRVSQLEASFRVAEAAGTDLRKGHAIVSASVEELRNRIGDLGNDSLAASRKIDDLALKGEVECNKVEETSRHLKAVQEELSGAIVELHQAQVGLQQEQLLSDKREARLDAAVSTVALLRRGVELTDIEVQDIRSALNLPTEII